MQPQAANGRSYTPFEHHMCGGILLFRYWAKSERRIGVHMQDAVEGKGRGGEEGRRGGGVGKSTWRYPSALVKLWQCSLASCSTRANANRLWCFGSVRRCMVYRVMSQQFGREWASDTVPSTQHVFSVNNYNEAGQSRSDQCKRAFRTDLMSSVPRYVMQQLEVLDELIAHRPCLQNIIPNRSLIRRFLRSQEKSEEKKASHCLTPP